MTQARGYIVGLTESATPISDQRIDGLRAKGIVVRDDCWCGLCTWAREEPPKNSAATLLKRRVSKPRRKPGRAPVP